MSSKSTCRSRSAAMGAVAVLLLSAGYSTALAAAGQDDPPPVPSPEEHQRFITSHRMPLDPAAWRVTPLTVHDEYDVDHYDIELSFDIPSQVLTGSVEVYATAQVSNLSEIELDLFDPISVDWVTAGGSPTTYEHDGGILTVTLDGTYQLGEAFEVAAGYHGTPNAPGDPLVWNEHAGVPIVSSLSEPFGAPAWWVCKDDPKDKATYSIHLTVPDTLVAVSNGTLDSVVANGNGTQTFNWTTNYPMSPYLFSISVTNYVGWTEVYTALGGTTTMDVHYYVYPEDLAAAQVSWSNNIGMMEYFASIFGEYPFFDEKYGIAEMEGSAAMEHQTCTSLGAIYVDGTHLHDSIIAHELAHSWVGDMITMTEWSHAWCKEGFATLCAALYFEDLWGHEYYHDYMNNMPVWAYAANQIYGIEPPLDGTIYSKGAWVLHMLRHVIGDATFFDAIYAYTNNYPEFRYGAADTEDLRSAFEDVSGMNLAWFFDQWIYSPGYPIYDHEWSAESSGGGYDIQLDITQTQSASWPIFKMPIDVVITTALGDERFTVWDSLSHQSFTLQVDGEPLDLALDPDLWILHQVVGGAGAAFVDVTPASITLLGDSATAGAWGDYDADGDLDLFVAAEGPSALFRNDGDLEFPEVPCGPLNDPVMTWNAGWADYDNDHDLDLFVTNSGPPAIPYPEQDMLARSDGGGVFVDVTVGALAVPTEGWGAQWGDFDNDGDLDLYLVDAREEEANRMYRNDGGDTFSLVPAGDASGTGPSWSCSTADFDDDGDLDIYVSRWAAPNLLLRNDGGFEFVDVADSLGVADSGNSAYGGWGDYDNDQDLDLFVCNYWGTGSSLYRNDGPAPAGFVDVTAASGIEDQYQPACAWFDFNNDGYLDLFFGNHGGPDRLYLNQGNGHFVDVASGPLQSGIWTLSPALADFDGDGDIDYFNAEAGGGTAKLLRNDDESGNHWLHVELVGNPDLGPPFSNVSAIGARVRLEAGGMVQIREVVSPTDISQSSLPVEFGLGLATSIDFLEVRWPSGRVDSCESPPFLDEQLSWVEGEPCPTTAVAASAQPALSLMLHQNYPNPFNPSTAIRYDLTEPGAVRIRVYDVEGRFVRLLEESAHAPAGSHTIRWDGRSDRGRAVASGIYYYRIEAGDWAETRPMVLVR